MQELQSQFSFRNCVITVHTWLESATFCKNVTASWRHEITVTLSCRGSANDARPTKRSTFLTNSVHGPMRSKLRRTRRQWRGQRVIPKCKQQHVGLRSHAVIKTNAITCNATLLLEVSRIRFPLPISIIHCPQFYTAPFSTCRPIRMMTTGLLRNQTGTACSYEAITIILLRVFDAVPNSSSYG